MSEKAVLRAYAKINLTLDVLGKRADGYHELASVMQTIALHDTLTLCVEKGAGARSDLVITTDHPTLSTDENNLVYRAARFLIDKADNVCPDAAVTIHIQKRIPVAAGLAGGSADCAATLRGLNALLGLRLWPEELQKIGVRFGADVPFCLVGGTALCTGIGDKVQPLTPPPALPIVLVHPPHAISTKTIFDRFAASCMTKNAESASAKKVDRVPDKMRNDLYDTAAALCPVIAEIKNALLGAGATDANMSGSGPSVFGRFAGSAEAAVAADHIRQKFPECTLYTTTPVAYGKEQFHA